MAEQRRGSGRQFIKLPVGIENFEKLRTEGFYYVDKTGLIRDLLRDLGIDLKLGDNDLKYILWKAKKTLEKGNAPLKKKPVLFRKENKANSNNPPPHIPITRQRKANFQNTI